MTKRASPAGPNGGDQVAAREAWLHWIDDEGYRGLNAGRFELLAESFVA